MNDKEMNDIFYVCSLIEYIARKTHNYRKDIIKYFSKEDIKRQLRLAEVNHCLSFEQVSDELIEEYHIRKGKYNLTENRNPMVSTATDIGRLFRKFILNKCEQNDVEQVLIDTFLSFDADENSDLGNLTLQIKDIEEEVALYKKLILSTARKK